MIPKDATQYRIENVRLIVFNGRKRKVFDAYERKGDAFIFCGAYTAPVRTANKNLWLIANEFDTTGMDE